VRNCPNKKKGQGDGDRRRKSDGRQEKKKRNIFEIKEAGEASDSELSGNE